MNEKYRNLFTPLTLNNGVVVNNRFAMAPMLVFASYKGGTPSAEELRYWQTRSEVGSLLITGAATISPNIKCGPGQMSIESDAQIEDFKALAKVMKSNGNKAIVQIQHPGREGSVGFAATGKAYAPSKIDFPFLAYPVTELTEEEVWEVVKDFGRATERLIEAGFDGVEIHGANHYLIQQFFSAYSNVRTDYWGGSLEKRMNFAIEVVKEVQRVRAASNRPDFIIGYRLSPEEVHGDNIGYTIDDTLKLVDVLADMNLDYLHTSTFGGADFVDGAYKLKARAGNQTKPINQLIYEVIRKRTAFMVSGNINSAEAALDASNYGDLLSMGVAAIADPQFANKIKAGQENTINMNVLGRIEQLNIPRMLRIVYRKGAAMPPIKGIY